jgi:hypothetical protein
MKDDFELGLIFRLMNGLLNGSFIGVGFLIYRIYLSLSFTPIDLILNIYDEYNKYNITVSER